ncbi:MAG: hypothetical protein BGO29_05925 [Bacteroidales bacterium 36-12]|nr:MAG: hypothetical protein BGO29_05925 [Bacteroidales bacterium 36-12]
MNTKVFFDLISNPSEVQIEQTDDLKQLIELYPYFYQARLLYLKTLQKAENIHFETQLEQTVLYTSDKQWLYFYLYPEMDNSNIQNHQREARFTGSYFDLLSIAEKKEGGALLTLKEIAENLKASRVMLAAKDEASKQSQQIEKKKDDSKSNYSPPDYFVIEEKKPIEDLNISLEDKYKKHIQIKEYSKAIEILKQLCLIYPKKSIYFADQIRFLEKVVENSK